MVPEIVVAPALFVSSDVCLYFLDMDEGGKEKEERKVGGYEREGEGGKK